LIAGKEKIAEYFEGLLEKHGDHYLSLDWKSKESQLARFAVLLDIISYSEKKERFSILDVGCGLAHFYEFLEDLKLIDSLGISYMGIDISRKIIEFAKNKFPKIDLQVVDLINDKFDKKFDYVMSSGIFNIRMADIELHKESVRKMISRMFNICNHGASINFLAKSSIYLIPEGEKAESEKYVYFCEEEVLSWARSISERYTLRRDYHPGDFTVYVLK